MSPVYLLIISLAFTSAVFTVVFLAAWYGLGKARHALLWSAAFAVALVQWVTNLNRASIDFEQYWLFVSALPILMLYLIAFGHASRCQQTHYMPWVGLFSLATYASIVVVTLLVPHYGLMIGIQPTSAGLVLLLCAWIMLRGGQNSLIEWLAIGATALTGFSQVAAGAAAMLQGWEREAFWFAWYQRLNFTVIPAAYVFTGVLMILVMAGDFANKLKKVASHDALTGVRNRRGFYDIAPGLFSAAKRQGSPLAAIMLDIDHFKVINDQHGHQTGDRALHHIARLLQHTRRAEDVTARLGGEEFVLLLPGANRSDAHQLAKALARQIESSPLVMPGNAALVITASFGVAHIQAEDEQIDTMLKRADQAMYLAKQRGRAQVVDEFTLSPA